MSLNRRDFIYGMGASLGSVALAGMMSQSANASDASPGPLALKKPHLPPKAKNCIFLMMEGGPSQIDTFDPKPHLNKLHRQRFTRTAETQSAMELGTRYYVRSPWKARQVGQSGAWMTEPWKHLPDVADDLCFNEGARLSRSTTPRPCSI